MSAPRPTLPPGASLLWFETLDSTNEEARRRAHAGVRGPLWIVAETQSAGRGRHGRSWVSAKGNLMATYLFAPRLSAESAAQLSFAAALAVIDVLDGIAPGVASVKWPNDILLRGRKVAGILLESETASGGTLAWLAMGVGINLVTQPQDTPFPATALAPEYRAPTPEAALEALSIALVKWIYIHATEGFGPLRAAWLGRAHPLGTPLRLHGTNADRAGYFAGLDDRGALLLADDTGHTVAIGAGEVFPTMDGHS